jgi:hypothetical protein
VQIPIEGQPIVRLLGIIHRRDRKLSETAIQFIALLQSQANPLSVEQTNGAMASKSNGQPAAVDKENRQGAKDAKESQREIEVTESAGLEVVSSSG